MYSATGPALITLNYPSAAYSNIETEANSYGYAFGTATSSESMFGVADKFYLYDNTRSAMDLAIDSSGNLGIGYATPYPSTFPALLSVGTAAQFQVNTTGYVTTPGIGSGVSGNTDLRGHITLVSGSGTYTFTNTFTVAPTCVATDTTSAAAVKVSATTTAFTLTGTGTDIVNYVCAD